MKFVKDNSTCKKIIQWLLFISLCFAAIYLGACFVKKRSSSKSFLQGYKNKEAVIQELDRLHGIEKEKDLALEEVKKLQELHGAHKEPFKKIKAYRYFCEREEFLDSIRGMKKDAKGLLQTTRARIGSEAQELRALLKEWKTTSSEKIEQIIRKYDERSADPAHFDFKEYPKGEPGQFEKLKERLRNKNSV